MINNLKSISIFLGNPFKGIKKLLIAIEENQITIKDNCPHKIYTSPLENEYIDKFLEGLNDLNIQNWNTNYITTEKVLDPDSWTITLNYQDSSQKEYHGVNLYPDNWNNLKDFISQYSNIFLKGIDE